MLEKNQKAGDALWIPRGPLLDSSNEADANPPQPMPAAVWRWLYSRGARNEEDVKRLLAPTLRELTQPLRLKDMDKALSRLVQAFIKDEHVCIYGDYDLDGSSGIALLVSGLRRLQFKNLSFYQPSRFKEGYGINADALKSIKERGAQVVVSVDCGVTAIDEAKIATQEGLELIITDHHQPREVLPECLAVINPNRVDDDSGLGHLSGVGVGFYLLLGLKRALMDDIRIDEKNRALIAQVELKYELDLLALGTIADMVPLKNENKVLVKHGLKILERTERPGLRALLQALDLLNREFTAADVAFQVAPKLNALARLELDLRPLDILMCDDPLDARNKAQRVLELNLQRKSIQTEMEEKALKTVDELIPLNPPAFVVAIEGGHPGVVGLVATKIVNLTGKPAFVVAFPKPEEPGVGSARASNESQDVTKAMTHAQLALERFGGHAQAGGFQVSREKVEEFKDLILSHYQEAVTETSQGRQHFYDIEVEIHEITPSVLEWLSQAEPFGVGCPAPLFRVKEAVVSQVRWLKDQHLKVTFKTGRGREIEGLAFFAKGLFDVGSGELVELIAQPTWNYWQGTKRLQLQIKDLRPLETGSLTSTN